MKRRTASIGLNQSTRPPTRTVRLHGLDPDDLADWLDQVVAHLGDDDTLPFLTHVHIRLANGRMHAMATDRYTGAITTLTVRTPQTARVTIPGEFARRAIAALRREDGDPDAAVPVSVDLTISDRIFGLTIHRQTVELFETDTHELAYATIPDTRRMAARLDLDADTINLPKFAAQILAAPSTTDPVHVNATLLMRFLGYGPILPLDTATGRLLPNTTDLFARYAVHNTGRVVILTRPDYLGLIATVTTPDLPEPEQRPSELAESRTAWRHHLAQIA